VARTVAQPDSEHIRVGNVVHAAIARALQDGATPASGAEAVAVKRVQTARLTLANIVQEELCERKLAFTRDMRATEWMADDVWLRVIIDAAVIAPPLAVVWDWKTGKVDPKPEQLLIFALAVFASYPAVDRVATEYVWLLHNASTKMVYTKPKLWAAWLDLMPRVARLETAHAENKFMERPGKLCRRWCAVTACVHNGK
jgi:hypothetical protein